jgi:ABC-type amino acid transport substrate-binding protein
MFVFRLLFCALLLITTPVLADPLLVVGPVIPGLLDSDGKGAYNKLFDAISAKSGVEMQIDLYPYTRTVSYYENGKYDVFFPATTVDVTRDSVETTEFNRLKMFIFTAAGTSPITSASKLKGLHVGLQRGIDFPEVITNIPMNVTELNNEVQGIKMLALGRIDAMVGLVPDVYLALQKLGGNIKLSVDTTKHYSDNAESFVFANKPEYAPIVDKLNQAIKSLRESGKIKQILGSAYVE